MASHVCLFRQQAAFADVGKRWCVLKDGKLSIYVDRKVGIENPLSITVYARL